MERGTKPSRLSEKGRGGVAAQGRKTRKRNGAILQDDPRLACVRCAGPVHISLLVNKLVRELSKRVSGPAPLPRDQRESTSASEEVLFLTSTCPKSHDESRQT